MKVAVIGCGVMGRFHARNYKQFKDVDLVAVCDIQKNVAKDLAKLYNANYYISHRDLIKKEALDAVSIAVPTTLHKMVARDFINTGVPVLVEKPLAVNIKEAKEILKAAKKKKVILAVGHIERFNPVITKLQDLVKGGAFGEILSIVVRRVGLFPPRVMDVNVVTDLAVHDLDIIATILGRAPKKIFARGWGSLTKGREDHAEIFMDYQTFGCFIQVNWVTPVKIRNLSITGTKGYAELNYITQKLEIFKSKYKVTQPRGFKEFVAKFGEPRRLELDLKGKEPLRLELENFLTSVKTGRKPVVGGEDAIRAMLLSEAAIKSIRSGKLIEII